MKRTINIIVSWLLVACIVLLILYFSLQNSTQSSNLSSGVIDGTIGEIGNGEVLDKLKEKYTSDLLSGFIRKIGHLIEYGALGFFLYNAIKISTSKKKTLIFAICVISFIFMGSLDEFIQSLSDRNGNIKDVLIDICGGIIGVLCMMFLHHIINKIKYKTLSHS